MDRADQSAAKVRSMLQIGPSEVGLIRIPSRFISSAFRPNDQEENEDSLSFIPRSVVAERLEQILRDGQPTQSRVEQVADKIDWSGNGIHVAGEITCIPDGAGVRMRMRIVDTLNGRLSIEVIGRGPPDCIGFVRLPGSTGDGLLVVPSGD